MTAIQTLKGFRDFLPGEVKKRLWLRTILENVSLSWGYQPIETPTLEPLELFSGQIGEDEKLFYQFTDNGGRNVALRYDQTVPTCRYIGQHYGSLTFPFRRYQMQPVFRAEKPQKGRYREFVQFDLDIFGVSDVSADAEVIATTLAIYKEIGFSNARALINNRDIFTGIPYKAIVAIDKYDKIGGVDGVLADMEHSGIPLSQAKEYLDRILKATPDRSTQTIMDYLIQSGISSEQFHFESKLARSFSYSQGPIWEIVIPDSTIGSVGGGERYDELCKRISGYPIPATGIGIGFDRTLEAADSLGLIPTTLHGTDILVTVFSPEMKEDSIRIASMLRGQGFAVELYPDTGAKLEKQLKYADKCSIPYVVILGPDEREKHMVQLKTLATRSSQMLSTDQIRTAITHDY